MAEYLLITGDKYNKNVHYVLALLLAIIFIGVMAVSGWSLQILPEPKVTVKELPVTQITADTLYQSQFLLPYMMNVLRQDGSYSFAKIENGVVMGGRLFGATQLNYQNGDSGLVEDKNGSIDIFVSKKGIKETVEIVERAVTGITLPDGQVLPVKVINGKILRGVLTGDFEMASLVDNSSILGKFDTRGNLVQVEARPSIKEPNRISSLVGKELLKLYMEMETGKSGAVLAATTDEPVVSGEDTRIVGEAVGASFFIVTKDVVDGSLGVVSAAPATVTTAVTPSLSGDVTVNPVTGLTSIGGGVVTGGKIANGAISETQLANDAVAESRIKDGAVTSNKISDGTISDTDISGSAAISDGKLATISTVGKVAGSAVQLSTSGGLTNVSGLSLLTSCSNGQILQWNGSAWVCATVSGGGSGVSSLNSLTGGLTIAGGGINSVSVLGSTITVTGTVPSLNPTYFTTADISQWTNNAGYITDGNTNWDNSYGFITASSSDILTNKTIAAGTNTITGLTNSNLSGTAGITDANLSQITTADKVAGSAVQLNANGGITNSTGLSLLTSCSADQILKWNGSAWICSADSTGGTPSFSGITGGTNVIAAMVVGTGASLNYSGTGTINASSLLGGTWASPGSIGSGTPNTGVFTTLTGSSSITDSGLTTAGVVTNTSAGLLGTLAGTTTTVLHGNAAGLPTFSSVIGSDLAANITISTTGNISTTGTGTITSAGVLTASNGLTMTTGALSLTSTSGSINSIGLTGLTQTLSSGTAAITAPTLNLNTSSTGNTSIGNATGTFALISNGGLNVTTGGALTGVASIDTIGVTATALSFAGTGTITSNTTNAITLDSGTTGAVNIGTGADAKTVTLGTTNTTATTIIQSGTGGILLTAGATGSSSQVRIGNSGTATPDLLVLDNGTADPTGINGGMYYNTTTGKFRCYEGSAWRNCVGSDVQRAASSFAVVTTTPVNTDVLLGTVSITPTTATGDVYISAILYANSLSGTNQTITSSIHSGTTCAGTTLASVTSSLTSGNGVDGPGGFVSALVTNPGASAQTYAICSQSSTNNGAAIGGQVTAMVIDTGADYAELYTSNDSSLTPGDVVAFDSSLKTGMKKSTKAYDNNLLGIITTNPGMVIGSVDGEGVRTLPVALSGRVPVKVSTENGEIKEGDFLTSSSIPGVAMKSTKAGIVIGQAMTGYSDNGVGGVLAFVKNGMSVGARIADIMIGIDTNNSSAVLTNILSQKEQITSGAGEVSEIFTDRVVSGLELVTPLVTAQDVMISRDATISGTLFVENIKARRIEGLELVTQKLSLLTEKVAGIASDSAEISVAEPKTEINIIDIVSQRIGEVLRNTVEFFGKVIFRGDVSFLGRTTFNKDTAGFATVFVGGNEVEVIFEKEYADEPVVTVTAQITGGASVTDVPEYAVADVNTKGFKIRLGRVTGMDIRFAWVALAVSEKAKFQGNGGAVITPTQTVETTPMPTPKVEESSAATISSISTEELSPAITPTPTMEVISVNDVSPTIDATPSTQIELVN